MNAHNLIYDGKELLVFGYNENGELGLSDNENRNKPTLLMQTDQIRLIVCGDSHTFILKQKGKLLTCGSNLYGQLGLGHNEDRNVPTLLMQYKTIRQIILGN